MLTHRGNWFGAVASLVGGVVETRSLAGRGAESFTRVPKEKQQEAVRFLIDHAFVTPRKLLAARHRQPLRAISASPTR